MEQRPLLKAADLPFGIGTNAKNLSGAMPEFFSTGCRPSPVYYVSDNQPNSTSQWTSTGQHSVLTGRDVRIFDCKPFTGTE